jgi:hypothetical protein
VSDTIDTAAILERFAATQNLRGEDGEESDGDELACEDCQTEIRVDTDVTSLDLHDTVLCHGCEKGRLRRSADDVPALLERIAQLTKKTGKEAKRGR